VLDILDASAHEALDRDDRVARIGRLMRDRLVSDQGVAAGKVSHDRGQQCAALFITKHFCHAMTHRGDE
jgi:hypothetical protein